MRPGAKSWLLSIGILLLCAMGGFSPSFGQTLELYSRQFVPPNDVTTEWSSLRDAAVTDHVHALIQLNGDLTSPWRDRLSAEGIVLHNRIPSRGFLATIPVALTSSDLASLNIRYAGELRPDDKIHPRLKVGDLGDWSVYTDNRRILAVTFFKDEMPDIDAIVAQFGGERGSFIQSTYTWIIAINPDNILDLALRDDVKWIEELPPPMEATNDIARLRTHAEQAQAAPYNLQGSGVTVCVYDAGLVDQTHNDFGGRVTYGEGGSVQSHATHVAGSVASSGALNGGQYRGMAPQAEIISFLYEACNPYCLYNSPQDIEANYGSALNTHGAHLCTNSIGSNVASNGYSCAWEGDYEITSQLLDEIVTGSLGSPFVVLYAAGNERGVGTCGTTYSTLGVPAGAKDIITVGATDDNDNISSFTSWGPPDDGRLKPDVSAPGVNIYSTLPGNQYGNMSGTSMATPVTAGCVALMMERFHQIFSATYRPLPSTIKALLCVSADDFGNAGPDYQFGHGRVNVQTAVDYMNIFGFLEGEVAQAETTNVQIQVTAGLPRLRIVLAWDDPAATPLSPITLINDLDLRLISPSSAVTLPLTTNPSNPGAPAAQGRNPRDNVEHAVIQNPESGTWTIQVVAYDIPGPNLSQSFALAGNVSLLAGVGTISGVISDSSSGDPLEGWVEVEGGPQVSYANPQGEYSFYLPGDSTYTLIAHMFGYEPRQAVVFLPLGGAITQDFALPSAFTGVVTGVVRDGYGDPLSNATVEVLSTPINPVQTNPQGQYTLTVPGGDTYTFRATWQTLQDEETVFVPANDTTYLDFVILDPQNLPTGPDNYGYLAYDNMEYENAPTFDWVEIDPALGGQGTVVALGEDETTQILLPFTFTYYGADYDSLSICCNGWVACGSTTVFDWSNSIIPDPDGPPGMMAPFWEDFSPQNGGVIAYWHDQAQGRFVVEYNHVPQWTPVGAIETFEIILYDPISHPTVTGDGEILFQYNAVVDPTECTVGIENFNQDDGLELLFNDTYDPNFRTLAQGLAVKFTTGLIPGYGSVAGQVTLHPSADPTQVTVTSTGRSTHPAANGTYQLDSVFVGTQTVVASLNSYETGVVTGVLVVQDSLTTGVDFDMYRLDPPTNLQASREDSLVTLWWHSPWQLDPSPDNVRTAAQNASRTANRSSDNVKGALPIGAPVMSVPQGGSSPLSMESFTLYRDDVAIQTGITDTTTTDILLANGVYDYTVRAIYTGGQSDTSNHVIIDYPTDVGENPSAALPDDFFLGPNYPNPFNPVTRITFGLPEPARVKISVVNILGQQVAMLVDDFQEAGYHRVVWDASRQASGLYFVVMRADNRVWIQKGLLLK